MSYEDTFTIPEKIKIKLTDMFYSTMWSELKRVFGDDVTGFDIYCDCPAVWDYESTCGWNEALRETCTRLNLKDVWEYYDGLECYDSDRFDGEIGVELGKRFSIKTNEDCVHLMDTDELAEFLTKVQIAVLKKVANTLRCDITYDECVDEWKTWLRAAAKTQ